MIESLRSIDQDTDDGGLEGYVVDSNKEQLDNWLSSEGAPPFLLQSLRNMYSKIAIIKNIWVDEEQRGQGIGSEILENAINDAIYNGANAIILVASADDTNDQTKLMKWYESFEFSTIATSSSGYPIMLLPLDKI